MFIQTEATPNPATLKFLPGRTVLATGTLEMRDKRARPRSRRSPSGCSTSQGVSGVFFGSTSSPSPSRTASGRSSSPRSSASSWSTSCPARRSWRRRERRVDERRRSSSRPATPSTVATIKELIETRVRPAVANDGGDITFRGFKDGVVYLAMKGSCSGCPSSTATLQARHPEPAAPFRARRHRSPADLAASLQFCDETRDRADAAPSCALRHRYRAGRLCAAAVLDSHAGAISQRVARDGARPRRGHHAADRARDGRGAANSPISTASPSPSGLAASPGPARRDFGGARHYACGQQAGDRIVRRSRRCAAAACCRRAPITSSSRRSTRATAGVYFQAFAPNGTTIVPPRLDRVRAAVRAVPVGPTVITGLGARPSPRIGRADRRRRCAEATCGARHRLGRGRSAPPRHVSAAPKPLYLDSRPDARPQDAGRLPRR